MKKNSVGYFSFARISRYARISNASCFAYSIIHTPCPQRRSPSSLPLGACQKQDEEKTPWRGGMNQREMTNEARKIRMGMITSIFTQGLFRCVFSFFLPAYILQYHHCQRSPRPASTGSRLHRYLALVEQR